VSLPVGLTRCPGRAGRDGKPCSAAVFLDSKTFFLLESLCFASSVDEGDVFRFVNLVLSREGVPDGGVSLRPLELHRWAEQFDMSVASMETVLAMLEQQGWLRLWPSFYQSVFVAVSRDALGMGSQEQDPLLRTICTELQQLDPSAEDGIVPAVQMLRAIASEVQPLALDRCVPALMAHLTLRLEGVAGIEDFSFQDPVWVAVAIQEGSDDYSAFESLKRIEQGSVRRLRSCYSLLAGGARVLEYGRVEPTPAEADVRERLNDYFSSTQSELEADDNLPVHSNAGEGFWKRELEAFVASHAPRGQLRSARSIARILHGVGSPAYPADVWRGDSQWARLRDFVDFEVLRAAARESLVQHRSSRPIASTSSAASEVTATAAKAPQVKPVVATSESKHFLQPEPNPSTHAAASELMDDSPAETVTSAPGNEPQTSGRDRRGGGKTTGEQSHTSKPRTGDADMVGRTVAVPSHSPETTCNECQRPRTLHTCGVCHTSRCKTCWTEEGTMFFDQAAFVCSRCPNPLEGRRKRR
jgi:hypothetical protein